MVKGGKWGDRGVMVGRAADHPSRPALLSRTSPGPRPRSAWSPQISWAGRSREDGEDSLLPRIPDTIGLVHQCSPTAGTLVDKSPVVPGSPAPPCRPAFVHAAW